ncbi:MAG: mannosyltransferase family protein [Chloroflexota bacterium]
MSASLVNSTQRPSATSGADEMASLGSAQKLDVCSMLEPLAIFCAFRLALFALGMVAQQLIPPNADHWLEFPGVHPLVMAWARWDACSYLEIARGGYYLNADTGMHSYAYFPLYPLLTHLLGTVIGDISIAGLLLASVSFALALVLLYGMVQRRLGRETARRACVFLAFSPFALFFGAVYTEPLFLLLALLSFDLAERNRWWLSGLAGALCTSSRLVGATLAPALLLLYLQRRGYKWRALDAGVIGPCLVPLGTIAYMGYSYIALGDPLAFYHAAMAWPRYNLFQEGLSRLNVLTFNPVHPNAFNVLNVGAALLTFAAVVPVSRLLGLGYGLFVLLATAIPFWAGVESLGRYVTVLFPTFITLAYYLRGPLWPRLVVVGWAMLLGLLTVLYVNWYWVV